MIEEVVALTTAGNRMWLTFVISAVLVVYAAQLLAKYSDVIAARTNIGGAFVGVLLLAGATSLPEIMTSINSISLNEPDLAAGNFFGSNAMNMFILAILDVASRNERVLRKSVYKHALSGGLAVFLGTLTLFLVCANPVLDQLNLKIGWVGIDSLVIVAFYIYGTYLIQANDTDAVSVQMSEEELESVPSLRTGIIGFVFAAAVLVAVSPFLVGSVNSISDKTGLGTTFVGSTLLALVTSMPELVTTISAVKIGAADMAIGNLFGSNMFNMFGIGLVDFFYTKGRFISVIDSSFIIVGLLGVLLTSLALIGNMAKFKRLKVIEVDSVIMVALYFTGMYILYLQ